jgi:hypothetical protein
LANGTAPSSPSQNSRELHGLLHILGTVVSVVSFVWLFSRLHTASDDARETARPQGTPEPERQFSHAPPGGPLVIYPPIDTNKSDNGNKDKTPFWEKAAVLIALGLLVVNLFVALSANDSAEWIKHQTRDVYNQHRPLIWVKVPTSVHIEVDKPIDFDIEVFNYGNVTGIARARIRLEAAPGVIERFRDTLRHHEADFPILRDQIGILKLPIPPGEFRHFPIESPELKLS